jgi:hypothetical protein
MPQFHGLSILFAFLFVQIGAVRAMKLNGWWLENGTYDLLLTSPNDSFPKIPVRRLGIFWKQVVPT